MRRANMPRDGSNMVAADDHLYVAIGNRCVAFDGQTGARLKNFEVPESDTRHQHDWGYISQIKSRLFGTAVRRGSHYLGDKGEWYEGASRKEIARVTSDSLFSIDTYTGELQWLYRGGVLINSTITITDGRIYFIESRSDQASEAPTGRLLDEVLQEQYLVAVDAASGRVIWEKPYDFSRCKYVTYMTAGNSTLLITGTDNESIFHTYAFDATNGEELWQHEAADKKKHHTGQLAHPTIVGDRVYFNKHTYELRTGKVLGVHNFNWHGCGIMSASNHSVFSRYEYHGMLNLKTQQRTEFLGIRSGCWLSLIPSGGLLLAPETSAGCSCGHSLQTSIAYVPKSLASAAHQE
jgi:outer membrane protein assembly factor BamB